MRVAIRRTAGVTLAQIAAELGVTTSAVWLWETGKRIPRPEYLVKYVELLRELGAND
jgi:transcriptional regulator with XRE-family HTH domain